MTINDIYTDNKDKILTGLSVIGIIASGISLIIGTRKAVKKANEEKLIGKEEFKNTWYYYLPGTILTLLSSAGVIFANLEADKKATALVVEYIALRSMMDNVKDELEIKLGKEETEELFKKAKQPDLNSNYTGIELDENDIFDKAGPNAVKFVDDFAGTEFWAQPEFMRMCRESLNQRYAFNYGTVSFKDWYGILMEELPTEEMSDLFWDISLTDINWIGIHYRLKEDSISGELFYSIEYELEPVDAVDCNNVIPDGWCGE